MESCLRDSKDHEYLDFRKGCIKYENKTLKKISKIVYFSDFIIILHLQFSTFFQFILEFCQMSSK